MPLHEHNMVLHGNHMVLVESDTSHMKATSHSTALHENYMSVQYEKFSQYRHVS